MRIKLDENLPVRLAAALNAMGNDVETVYSEGLSGAKDDVVWTVSQDERRLLITQDLDFSDSRRFHPGMHHGIILVRIRTPGASCSSEGSSSFSGRKILRSGRDASLS